MRHISFIKLSVALLFIWTCSGGGDGGSPTEPTQPTVNPPIAENINVTTNEDTPTVITLQGSDTNNAPLSYSITKQAGKGTFSLSGSSGTYTPNANVNGDDEIQYIVSNGTTSSGTATVAITINAVDDNPESIDVTITTNEDTPTSFTLEANEYDGDNIKFQIDETTVYGTLTLSGNQVQYTPNENWFGVENFTFSVYDDNNRSIKSGNGTIVVNSINDSPSSNDIYDIVAPYNEITAIPLIGDDADGDNLAFELYTDATKGMVTVSNDTAYFAPTVGLGADTFEYRTYDGSEYSDTGTVHVDVANNDLISFASNILHYSSSNSTTTYVNFVALDDGSIVFAGPSNDSDSHILVYQVRNNQIVNQTQIERIHDDLAVSAIIQNNDGNIIIAHNNIFFELDTSLNLISTIDKNINIYNRLRQLSNDMYFDYNNRLYTSTFDEVVTGFVDITHDIVFHDGFYYRLAYRFDSSVEVEGNYIEKYDSSFNLVQESVFLSVVNNRQIFFAEEKIVIMGGYASDNYGIIFDLDLNHLNTKKIDGNLGTVLEKGFVQVDDGFIYSITEGNSSNQIVSIAKMDTNLNLEFVSTGFSSYYYSNYSTKHILALPNAYVFAEEVNSAKNKSRVNLGFVTLLGNRIIFD